MQPRIVVISSMSPDFLLTAEQLLKLTGSQGQQVMCLEGRAWISACGLVQDVLLLAGQSFAIPNDGLTLIGPVGPMAQCRVRLERLPQRRLGRMLACSESMRWKSAGNFSLCHAS